MNFDFKVIAKSFPAICAVISFACFLLGFSSVGWFFAVVAVVSFVLWLFASRQG
jgi:hypothetical protein